MSRRTIPRHSTSKAIISCWEEKKPFINDKKGTVVAVTHDGFHGFGLHVVPDHKIGALMSGEVPVMPREKKFIKIIKMRDTIKMIL